MSDARATPKICLNMIVKNESAIIDRCLDAMAGQIDAAVICDTGSSDDTIERIKAACARQGVPCEVPQFAFHNFEQARNAALEAAKASALDFDYILLTDADMVMEVENPNWKADLDKAFYRVRQYTPRLSYYNTRLVRRDTDCRYVGVTHEYIDCAGDGGRVEGMAFNDTASGANRVDKYERDARLLLEALETDIDDDLRSRYLFYLGQTYFDIDEYEKAIDYYQKRVEIGGWAEETFYALYRIGLSYQGMIPNDPGAALAMVGAMMEAYAYRPSRIEPLYILAKHYREREAYAAAYTFARRACDAPDAGGDMLFVWRKVYDAMRWDELSVAAYWTGRYDEALDAANRALMAEDMPIGFYERVRENRGHAVRKLASG